jgi:signal transduction histidine kinase
MKQRAVDAEAAADLAVERGVAEERLRIARDLHDAVGHEVAVISMNLGAAEVQLPDGSAGARAALTAARVGVKGVLNEIQQILDVLRRGDAGADAAPVADVGQISDLVNTLQAAGTPISASIDHIGLLNPGVSAAAFRIAQEALTNAQRHGTGPIRLSVSSDAHEVIIDVQNARPSHEPARRGSGYGLTGMKERAESVGGRLEVIADAKTFHIRAHLMRAANDHR